MSADPDEHSMTLWEHLEELRARMVKMIVAFVVGAGVAWWKRELLLDILTRPFVESWKDGAGGPPALHFQTPASGFIAYVTLAALAGLVFALPIVLYQVWAFIAPGLYVREKRFAIPFVVSSCLLFVGGAYFGWRFAFPPAFEFLIGVSGKVGDKLTLTPTVMLDEYVSFVTHMLLAFGAVAELPVVAFFLSVLGVITHVHLLKFFRYFVVIAFVIAAVITPPDPLSQFMLAVPLIALYGVSILIAWIFGKRRLAAADADSTPAKP